MTRLATKESADYNSDAVAVFVLVLTMNQREEDKARGTAIVPFAPVLRIACLRYPCDEIGNVPVTDLKKQSNVLTLRENKSSCTTTRKSYESSTKESRHKR